MRPFLISNGRRTYAVWAALPLLLAAPAGCAVVESAVGASAMGGNATEEELLAAGQTWIDGYYHGKGEAEDLHKLFTRKCRNAYPEAEFWFARHMSSGMEHEISNVTAKVSGDSGEIRYTRSGAFPDLVDLPDEEAVIPWKFEFGKWRNADCITGSG